MNKALGRGADVSDNLSFTISTADATGKDRRTIERANARGAALGDDLGSVAETSLDKGVELDAQLLCSLDVIPTAAVGRRVFACAKGGVKKGHAEGTSCR